jgi:hypothetical protein
MIHSVQRSGPVQAQTPRPSRPRTNRPRDPNTDECRRRRAGRAGARSRVPLRASARGSAAARPRPTQSANKCARCRDAKEKKQTSSMLLQPPDFPWLLFATRALSLSLSLSLFSLASRPLLCCHGHDQPWLARASTGCRARASQ